MYFYIHFNSLQERVKCMKRYSIARARFTYLTFRTTLYNECVPQMVLVNVSCSTINATFSTLCYLTALREKWLIFYDKLNDMLSRPDECHAYTWWHAYSCNWNNKLFYSTTRVRPLLQATNLCSSTLNTDSYRPTYHSHKAINVGKAI